MGTERQVLVENLRQPGWAGSSTMETEGTWLGTGWGTETRPPSRSAPPRAGGGSGIISRLGGAGGAGGGGAVGAGGAGGSGGAGGGSTISLKA